MSRAPILNKNVIDSLKKLTADLQPTDYIGTEKEAGVAYVTKLIKHFESPDAVKRRQALADTSRAWRKGNK